MHIEGPWLPQKQALGPAPLCPPSFQLQPHQPLWEWPTSPYCPLTESLPLPFPGPQSRACPAATTLGRLGCTRAGRLGASVTLPPYGMFQALGSPSYQGIPDSQMKRELFPTEEVWGR